MTTSQFVRRLALSRATGEPMEPEPAATYAGGRLAKGFLTNLVRGIGAPNPGAPQPFTGKFWGDKHPYNPSIHAAPRFAAQVRRALGRGRKTPKQVQAELSVSNERLAGKQYTAPSPTAPAAGVPAGFGGGGNSGAKSFQLGVAPTAGYSATTAPVAAPPLPPGTAPSPSTVGSNITPR